MSIATSPCTGCGKPIVWGRTADGKDIPLDPVPAVYVVTGNGEKYRVQRANGNKEKAVGQAMVSHFATCPKAADFSGRNRKAGDHL